MERELGGGRDRETIETVGMYCENEWNFDTVDLTCYRLVILLIVDTIDHSIYRP